ncbi:MAG: BglII/BstYI family type II restriction endonuclease [Schlesneria sp.]
MEIQVTDFNGAGALIASQFTDQWAELEYVLSGARLHLKKSDQAGIQGNLIFDPVGTNEFIKNELKSLARWNPGLLIPSRFKLLGTDVDFVSDGLLVEVQFSNYPFLLNNTVRSELFFKSKTLFAGVDVQAVVIVTKAKMFPASNSTLYYEQALQQLSELAKYNVFTVPVRLVGLFEQIDKEIDVVSTIYSKARYSRTVLQRSIKKCVIRNGKKKASRCKFQIVE